MEITPKDIEFARKYAITICKKWKTYCDDDLVGAALEGLSEASIEYDPKKSRSFRKYAGVKIRNAMVQYLRDNFGHRTQCAHYKDATAIEFNHNSRRFSCDGLESRVIAKDLLYKFFNILSESQRRRLDLRIEGLDNRQIARLDGVSPQAVNLTFWRIKKKADKWRKEFYS